MEPQVLQEKPVHQEIQVLSDQLEQLARPVRPGRQDQPDALGLLEVPVDRE